MNGAFTFDDLDLQDGDLAGGLHGEQKREHDNSGH
jgi:hypothetical protein